ncbi:MAG: PIN domain-containing protein [Bacteriovorax sp.]|nr:PIN domain-containing protein [Bacteriovorax sp.]
MIAVIDANVLYKASLRDLLMYLMASDAFQGKWSVKIHMEWTSNLIANGRDESKVLRTRKLMDEYFPDAIVSHYQHLIKKQSLPEIADRHVLAAAIKAKADFIITENLKHFPKKHLPENLRAVSPDEFLVLLSRVKPHQVLSGVKAHRGSLKNPPFSILDYVQARKDQGLKEFATFLMAHRSSI